jgi:hypothetical protein
MVCIECGQCFQNNNYYIYETIENVPYRDDYNWKIIYCYKTEEYFERIIRQFLSIQNTNIPQNIINMCKSCNNFNEIIPILKKNKKSKYYPYRFIIWSIINKDQSKKIKIDLKIIEILKDLFHKSMRILRENNIIKFNKKKTISVNFLINRLLEYIYDLYGNINGVSSIDYKIYFKDIKCKKSYENNLQLWNEIKKYFIYYF